MDAIIRRKGSQESKNEPKPRKWPRETASNAKFVQLNGWFLNRGSSIWFKAHAAKSWQLLLLYIIKINWSAPVQEVIFFVLILMNCILNASIPFFIIFSGNADRNGFCWVSKK